jgi:DNA-binding transcriptional ArsR family regulator
MESVTSLGMIRWLRAAGEPSRLRLLALCAQGELSVADLAQALGQSEPRMSRHLKILCEAGLIERQRQGQWVHYRVARTADAASFVGGLLAQLDRRDEQLLRDRSVARRACMPAAVGLGESRLGRALAGFIAAASLPTARGPALVVGVRHPELLQGAVNAAHSCVAIAHSRRAAQAARTYIERHALPGRVIEGGSLAALREADIARAGAAFSLVILDHPAADGHSLARTLELARGALAADGQLWIFEGYDALETSRQRIVEHPLARLRRLLSEAGLRCERLSPLEADGEHVLAALARGSSAATLQGSTGAA